MTLNDVCEFIVDCPHSTANDEGAGFPLIRTPNVGKGRLLLDEVHRVSEPVYKVRNVRATPQDDDLILAREAPAGNVAIIKNGEKVCLGQRTVLLRPNKKVVDPDFLTYYLLAPQQQYELLGTANGATVAHVNIPVIKSLPVQLPAITEQKRIGSILSAHDDLIENNQRQIKLLEEAAQRLYKEWFVDLHFPGHEQVPVVDGVPEGWKQSTVGDCCELQKKVLSVEDIPDDCPYIGLEHIPRKDFCLSQWGSASEVNSNKVVYAVNDIIFGQIRPYFHKVGFAINNGVASTDSFIMRPYEDVWGLFLLTASSSAFVNYSYQTCKEGAKMPRADWRQMAKYKVLIAPEDIQKSFEKTIREIANKVKAHALQIHALTEARDRLLPKLMSGEIAV